MLYAITSGGATAELAEDEAVGTTEGGLAQRASLDGSEQAKGTPYHRIWSCISGLSAGASRRAHFWRYIESKVSGLRTWPWKRRSWCKLRRRDRCGGSWADQSPHFPCCGLIHGERGGRYGEVSVNWPGSRGKSRGKRGVNIRTVEPLGTPGALVGPGILMGAEMPRQMIGTFVDPLAQVADMSRSR